MTQLYQCILGWKSFWDNSNLSTHTKNIFNFSHSAAAEESLKANLYLNGYNQITNAFVIDIHKDNIGKLVEQLGILRKKYPKFQLLMRKTKLKMKIP